MIYKKSVVLNALDNSLKKAVVYLDSRAGIVKGDVKLFNFVEEPIGNLTLGLAVDGKVHKASLTRVGYMQYTFSNILSKIPGVCTCAIVSSREGNFEPLLLGSIKKENNNFEEILFENLNVLDSKNIGEVKKVVEENIGDYEDKEEIEEKIDECLTACGCEHCEYKKVFYEGEKQEDVADNVGKISKELENEEHKFNFFQEVSEQINGLFEKFPPETELEEIIADSKWVRIDFNEDGKYYVVGLIYENGEIKYVCYGVPAMWSENPPADFNENAQWLPIDLDEPEGRGYWITYQDANDGNLIEVNVI